METSFMLYKPTFRSPEPFSDRTIQLLILILVHGRLCTRSRKPADVRGSLPGRLNSCTPARKLKKTIRHEQCYYTSEYDYQAVQSDFIFFEFMTRTHRPRNG